MTKQEAIEFGVASAKMAIDAQGDWDSLEESIASYRENVRTTLQESNASQFEAEAFAAFDAIANDSPDAMSEREWEESCNAMKMAEAMWIDR